MERNEALEDDDDDVAVYDGDDACDKSRLGLNINMLYPLYNICTIISQTID